MTRRNRSAWTRALLTVAVAVLPLLGDVSGALHMLLVRHVVCHVHGELLEAGDAHLAASEHAPSRAADSHADEDSPAQPHVAPSTERWHASHDECACGFAGRQPGLLEHLAPARGVQRVASGRIDHGSPSTSTDSFARYLLAPKQSPPA